MLQYVASGSGLNGDFHGLGFRFGNIKGYFAVMPDFKINVCLLNDIDLPPGLIDKFVPLASELQSNSDELAAKTVHRLDGEDYTVEAVTEALCYDCPEDPVIGKPRDVVRIFVQEFENALPALGEQVRTYEQFLDCLEGPAVIGGQSARQYIDPEAGKIFGEQFYDRLKIGVRGEDADLFYPATCAAWKGVLLRRAYRMQEANDPIFGRVEIFSSVGQ